MVIRPEYFNGYFVVDRVMQSLRRKGTGSKPGEAGANLVGCGKKCTDSHQ